VKGLPCVTVLIGAYHVDSGLPIMGVVYQPFHCKLRNQAWESRYYWGFSYNGVRLNNIEKDYQRNINERNDSSTTRIISSGRDEVIHKLPNTKVIKSRGAGYKALCVILGQVDCYPLTLAACYKWDTCAPHALLLSMGGGLIDLHEMMKQPGVPEELVKGKLDAYQLVYNKKNTPPHQPWLNQGGLVAYTASKQSKDSLCSILKCL